MALQFRIFKLGKKSPQEEVQVFLDDNALTSDQVVDIRIIQKTDNVAEMVIFYEDTVRPTVLATAPGNGAVNVPVNTDIIVQFSEAVGTLAAPLVAGDFSVVGSTSGAATIGSVDGNATSTVTLNITGSFSVNEVVTVTVKTSVADSAGNTLAVPHTFSFSTATLASTLEFKGGREAISSAEQSQGYKDISFGSAFDDADYVVHTDLESDTVFPGVSLRVTNRVAAGFRVVWDEQDLSSVRDAFRTVADQFLDLDDEINTSIQSEMLAEHPAHTGVAAMSFAVTHDNIDAAATGIPDVDITTAAMIHWGATRGLSG